MPKIEARQVAGILRQVNQMTYRAIATGAYRGALKGKRHIVPLTPVDRGDLRRSWRAIRRTGPRAPLREAASLYNDAPHAGIIEGGARPHGVSAEGRESIEGWVRRHFRGISDREARSITWGIVRKLKREGQKATWFVREELERFRDLVGVAIDGAVRRVAAKPPRGGR